MDRERILAVTHGYLEKLPEDQLELVLTVILRLCSFEQSPSYKA